MPLIHDKPIAISESQLDSFGHLNHARYFELFEQARWDIITERGFGIETIRQTKTGPVILEVNVRFMRELAPRESGRHPQRADLVRTKVGKFRQQIVKADGGVACDAVFSFGLFDIERRRLVDPTPEWAYAVGIDAAADRSAG